MELFRTGTVTLLDDFQGAARVVAWFSLRKVSDCLSLLFQDVLERLADFQEHHCFVAREVHAGDARFGLLFWEPRHEESSAEIGLGMSRVNVLFAGRSAVGWCGTGTLGETWTQWTSEEGGIVLSGVVIWGTGNFVNARLLSRCLW